MREYFTEAVVLEKEPLREKDARVVLFTPSLGKISAKVTSSRKITSKLSAHLEPLSISEVRLVEKGGVQVADALCEKKLDAAHLPAARLIAGAFLEGAPDRRLYLALRNGEATVPYIFEVLGLDLPGAACASCEKRPSFFHLHDWMFACNECLPHSHRNEDWISVLNEA